jgi:hypothetical protein
MITLCKRIFRTFCTLGHSSIKSMYFQQAEFLGAQDPGVTALLWPWRVIAVEWKQLRNRPRWLYEARR